MTREAYYEVINAPHRASLTHELLAAAAAYQAMKAWNEHKERNGETVNHAMMQQFLAAASGAFIDHMIETKGLDALDRHRAKRHAEEYHYQELQRHYPQYYQDYQGYQGFQGYQSYQGSQGFQGYQEHHQNHHHHFRHHHHHG